ncbi:hypothetical protein [Saccharopolyspora flava]|uniref:hypothetical protein n=1 Tax=Saccharopolyspora flava TaxID=95161 RepID=UPI001C31AFE3|nr:hypothetical protein [Saccharopolyspora flava]
MADTRPLRRLPAPVPRLLDGVEPVGELRGSGYREPPQLVRRADGELVRLPWLLHSIIEVLQDRPPGKWASPDVELPRLAAVLLERCDVLLRPEQLAHLIDHKLAPLGLTTFSDGSTPRVERKSPFLALRFKLGVFGEGTTWFIAGLFSWLFHPLVMTGVLTATFMCEGWVLLTQDLGAAMRSTLGEPVNVLLVLLLALVSTTFHEFGHAAACRYGGARPGVMGCGIYVVWPAFYTDITDSYRLDRAGRLRADLGGVYFNGLVVVVLTLLYLRTGFEPLLVIVLATNLEIVQQLLPTLRFDGYYIMADLVGVPDLYKYIGPILRQTFLRQPQHEQLKVLRRWPQLMVSAWVLLVVPALIVQLGLIAFQLPGLLETIGTSIHDLAGRLSGPDLDVLTVTAGALQILFMLLPVAGLALMLWLLLRALLRRVLRPRSRAHQEENP